MLTTQNAQQIWFISCSCETLQFEPLLLLELELVYFGPFQSFYYRLHIWQNELHRRHKRTTVCQRVMTLN